MNFIMVTLTCQLNYLLLNKKFLFSNALTTVLSNTNIIK
jgi:hypothetical protein